MDLKKELRIMVEYILPPEDRDKDVIENYVDTLVLINEEYTEQLILSGVVNCVYVVTERDNYGEQLFKGVFANREKAIEYLAKDGLKESNIDEINEIELD